MFLADGSFWQVGVVSEEGAQMDNAEAYNSAASPLPAQRRQGRRIPVPIQPRWAVGTIYFHKYKRKAASMDLNLGMGQGNDPDSVQHLKGWGRLSIVWYPWMPFLEST